MINKKAKLIWDFYGSNGRRIAEHHLNHLKEFCEIESISLKKSGIEKINSNAFEVYLVVEMKCVEKIKNKLKPNKGFAID